MQLTDQMNKIYQKLHIGNCRERNIIIAYQIFNQNGMFMIKDLRKKTHTRSQGADNYTADVVN